MYVARLDEKRKGERRGGLQLLPALIESRFGAEAQAGVVV